MPRDGFNFRSRGAFSQPISQLWNEEWGLRNGTRVPRRLRNGAMATKLGFLKLWGFRRAFCNCEMRLEAAKWHLCAMGVFRSCKNFRRGGHGAGKSFCSQGAFSQPNPDFAAGFLGLQNYFATKGHFRRGPFWAVKFHRPWIFPCF